MAKIELAKDLGLAIATATMVTTLAVAIGMLFGVHIEKLYPSVLGPALAFGAITVAANRYHTESAAKRSNTRLIRATDALKRAVDDFCPQNINELPPNNRLTWLNVARLLWFADKESRRLNEADTESYKYERTYARLAISVTWGTLCNAPEDYFAIGPHKYFAWSEGDREPISSSSVKAIRDWKQINLDSDHLASRLRQEFSEKELENAWLDIPTFANMFSAARERQQEREKFDKERELGKL